MGRYPAVLQIRNGSRRCPGKAMKEILGRPVIQSLVERITAVSSLSGLIVATSTNHADDAIERYCIDNHIRVFRGREDHVLDRIYHCANGLPGEYFVKFWGDSPLIDPTVCDDIIEQFETRFSDCDYVSNNHPSTYPEGMQIEIIKKSALEKAFSAGDLTDDDREHVTPYIWNNPHLFKIGNVEYATNLHDAYRICLDYPEDLIQIRAIVESLYPQNHLFGIQDIIQFLDAHPDVKNINHMHY